MRVGEAMRFLRNLLTQRVLLTLMQHLEASEFVAKARHK